jgi:hypothetical protein
MQTTSTYHYSFQVLEFHRIFKRTQGAILWRPAQLLDYNCHRRAGRPGNDSQQWQGLFYSSPRPHRHCAVPSIFLCSGYRRLLLRGQSGRGVNLITHSWLLATLRTCGPSPPLPHMPSRAGGQAQTQLLLSHLKYYFVLRSGFEPRTSLRFCF